MARRRMAQVEEAEEATRPTEAVTEDLLEAEGEAMEAPTEAMEEAEEVTEEINEKHHQEAQRQMRPLRLGAAQEA